MFLGLKTSLSLRTQRGKLAPFREAQHFRALNIFFFLSKRWWWTNIQVEDVFLFSRDVWANEWRWDWGRTSRPGDSKGDTKEAAPQSLWSVETDSVWRKEFMTSPINSSVWIMNGLNTKKVYLFPKWGCNNCMEFGLFLTLWCF